MMKLKVESKNVYGNETIYPACKVSTLLCRLAGTKTFTSEMIHTCKELGYEFELVAQKSAVLS